MSHKSIWYIKEIPTHLCDLAVNDFLTIPPQDASMGHDGEIKNHQYRNTTIRFVQPGHWFSYILHGFAKEANSICRWNYNINGYQDIQFAEYAIDQHYDWHTDFFPLAESEIDRKISIVCLLSDPSEFEGGKLELKLYSTYEAPLKKGSVIVFPSMIEHRVTPVVSGLRRTATVWMNGPRFK